MLFPDLSVPQARKNEARPRIPVAFVSDRFLALLLDFLIFSPVVSLFIAGLMQQIKTYFLLDYRSAEGYAAAGFMFAYGVAVVIFLQSVFLFFWQATPGQRFMQLRVLSYPVPRDRLTYPQCLLRAFCWTLGTMFLGIPFMEIASHPLRRAFHERVSDTVVITLKKQSDVGPLPIEEKFISSWLRMSFLFAMVFVTLFAMRAYNGLLAGDYRVAVDSSLYCREIQDDSLHGKKRLDMALSLYLLNGISAECLSTEADAALWGHTANGDRAWAYLAKYVVADVSEQKAYLAKVCENKKSNECELGRYMAGDKKILGDSTAQASLTEQVLRVDELYTLKKYTLSLEKITALQKVSLLEPALEKKFVRSIWGLQGTVKKGREPASSDDAEKWMEAFKARYLVP